MEHSVVNNILKRLARHKHGLAPHTIMHPIREWWIWITLFVLIVAASAAWGAFLFISYDTEFISTESTPTRVRYNAETVNAALQKYRTRSIEFSKGEPIVVSTEQPDLTEASILEPDILSDPVQALEPASSTIDTEVVPAI